MYILEISMEQINNIKLLIDLNLRANGLDALSNSVELSNLLNSAKIKEDYINAIEKNIRNNFESFSKKKNEEEY